MQNEINKLFNVDVLDQVGRILQILEEENQSLADSNVVEVLHEMAETNIGRFDENPRNIEEVIDQSITKVFKYRLKNNHPKFFGFVPSPSSLISWIGEILSTGYNVHAGSWLQSSGYSYLELKLVAWLCQNFGFDESAGGIFLSGGSMANMTGLLLARDTKLGEDERAKGVAYLSSQTHSSVAKALKMIGLLPHQIKTIGVNEGFQMDVGQLCLQVEDDLAKGLKPFLVIASAGTTNTGSIDDLNGIAQIAGKHQLWMHVDGAYGGSVILADKYRQLLKGIEHADSISCDPHKWMFQTYGCSVLLVKEKKYLYGSFHTNPEYLKDAATVDEQVNFWDLGPELTRPARAFKLWFTLQVAGTKIISEAISTGFETAKFAESILREDARWEIMLPAQMAIINFRYFDPKYTASQLNEINLNLSRLAIERGRIGVLSTKLNHKNVLRMCCINPLTTQNDIKEVIQLLSAYLSETLQQIESNLHLHC